MNVTLTKEYQFDIANDIYDYLRLWWGLARPSLTDKKCQLLGRSVSKWRKAYRDGKYSQLRRMYSSDTDLAGYLAAFGPRYAYSLNALLEATSKRLRLCRQNEDLRVCYLGGGGAIDLVGLLAYLYQRGIRPRDAKVTFVDRSPEWRRFHNALFATILPKYFRKTRFLPYYHDVDLADPTPRYDSGIQQVLETRVFILSNVLSEFEDQSAIREHMRFLMRGCRYTHYLIVADSSAPKLRPRVSSLDDFVADLGFPYYQYFDGVYDVDCDWLVKDEISKKVFSGGPTFQTSVKRYGFVARILAGSKGECRNAKDEDS